MVIVDPQRGGGVRLDRHDLDRAAGVHHRVPVFLQLRSLLFVIGGVSGFMTASVPVDWQLTDTYFVVAHLHYVLIGINVFPVVGGIYFWFPKITGRLMDERLGKMELLDHVHRLQRRLLPDAHPRPARHAATHLHLPERTGLGDVEHGDHARLVPVRDRHR